MKIPQRGARRLHTESHHTKGALVKNAKDEAAIGSHVLK
jgi:hypothetical protein